MKCTTQEGEGRSPAGIVDLKSCQTRRFRFLENLVNPTAHRYSYIWLMCPLRVVDLVGKDIHILCLAASSEKVKPLLY